MWGPKCPARSARPGWCTDRPAGRRLHRRCSCRSAP
ncbi:hypothetical protein EVA_15708 [gut metagenome]|uniref:Uncharacterized protein n=1 Tax=gut metagenome TaxID=749906 RepID=J9G9R5_9ZZZZ